MAGGAAYPEASVHELGCLLSCAVTEMDQYPSLSSVCNDAACGESCWYQSAGNDDHFASVSSCQILPLHLWYQDLDMNYLTGKSPSDYTPLLLDSQLAGCETICFEPRTESNLVSCIASTYDPGPGISCALHTNSLQMSHLMQ